jgi:16S rRNA processing protein RimM
MKTLSFQNCILIGFFQKIHGVSGTLLLNFEPEWELSVLNTDLLVTETDGLPVPWFIAENGIRITTHKTALIDLDWIEDEKAAKRLCGNPVYLEKNKILSVLEDKNLSQWIGFSIYSDSGNLIGKITGEENYSGNIVVSVKVENGEQLIPFHPDLIKAIDYDQKKITMCLPEGLSGI